MKNWQHIKRKNIDDGSIVVTSMETNEKSLTKLELYEKLAQVEAQINNGEESLDGEKVFNDLKNMPENKYVDKGVGRRNN